MRRRASVTGNLDARHAGITDAISESTIASPTALPMEAFHVEITGLDELHAAIAVTSEHATDELIAAMEWLIGHEDQARAMAPLRLFIMMRGVATRSSLGSGRAARADALHGMTNVSPGDAVAWTHPDAIGLAS